VSLINGELKKSKHHGMKLRKKEKQQDINSEEAEKAHPITG
jgi:hypothetical protein